MATFLTDEINWMNLGLARPTPPPGLLLPGMANFDQRVAGREGDILVIQVRSSTGISKSARESMRSLGLSGIGSFSLRLADDPVVRGYIRAAREYIGVVDLEGLQYREQGVNGVRGGEMYERPYYGTNSNPAQLVRDSRGNYFQYESSRDHLLLCWNSSREFNDALELFLETYGPQPTSLGQESVAVIPNSPGLVEETPAMQNFEVARGEDSVVVDARTDLLLPFIRDHSSELQLARVAFDSIELTWQSSFRKFDDRETEFCEVGLIGPPALDLELARTFAEATGVPKFFEDARCQVEVRGKTGSVITRDF